MTLKHSSGNLKWGEEKTSDPNGQLSKGTKISKTSLSEERWPGSLSCLMADNVFTIQDMIFEVNGNQS